MDGIDGVYFKSFKVVGWRKWKKNLKKVAKEFGLEVTFTKEK